MKNKLLTSLLLPLLSVSIFSCSKGENYSDGKIFNDSFESNLSNWSSKGDKVDISSEYSFSGDKSLKMSNSSIVNQKIKNIKPGLYYLEVKTRNEGNQEYCYAYAKGSKQDDKMTSIPRSIKDNEWSTVTIRGIKVDSDGLLEVGFVNKGHNQSVYFDDVSLHLEARQDKEYPSLFGGAISWLDWEVDKGAKYYDFDHIEKSALEIMKENGCNFVRLELYNNPGHYVDENGNYLPSGYKDEDAIYNLALLAKSMGMDVELSFMYSDYWGNSAIPYDWMDKIKDLSSFQDKVDSLSNSIYQFTYSFMNRLKNANIYPKYVSIGNEIEAGILLPYGSTYEHPSALADFLKSGYKAVKDVMSDSQVVLHLGANADDMHWINKYGSGRYFFDLMNTHYVPYDIIGTSYYPFWAQSDSEYAIKKKLDLVDLKNWCELMIDTYDKDILIMESGYNWGTPGQLANNGAYEGIYLSSKEGQRDYVLDLINTIKSVKDGRCLGLLYWDPILVRQSGVGYALYDDGQVRENVVETTTFFSYDHVALPVLNAFRYN